MKRLTVISGAGISAESGMKTFRGSDGLWNDVPLEEICTPRALIRNHRRVMEFYNDLRQKLEHIQPNEAHRILAEMQDSYDVNIITQNVDNLHERAGSRNVLHLHGELTKVRPMDCYTESDGYSTRYVQDIGYRCVREDETGGPGNTRLRPHIVFFEEAVPNLGKAVDIVMQSDILLIIGTSLQVYPAAMLHTYAPYGCRIYIIDPDESPAGAIHGVTHIKKVATEGMIEFKLLISSIV